MGKIYEQVEGLMLHCGTSPKDTMNVVINKVRPTSPIPNLKSTMYFYAKPSEFDIEEEGSTVISLKEGEQIAKLREMIINNFTAEGYLKQ